jgi:hypothetical protein
MQCARSLEPTMHTACAPAAAAEHRTQTSGPCRAPRYERDQVPCRRRRPAQRQRARGPPSLRCSSPPRLRARRSRAHRSRRRRASRVAEHPADRIRRGTAKQAGRVRRRRGQPDLGTDHRKLGNVWRTAESNYGSSPYHLGATRSIEVVEAGHRALTVTWGRCRAVRLLHFAAALLTPAGRSGLSGRSGASPVLRLGPHRRVSRRCGVLPGL